jgi:hypothetical protein
MKHLWRDVMATFIKALKDNLFYHRTPWSYVTGASVSQDAGEVLSVSLSAISVVFIHSVTKEKIRVTCTGGGLGAAVSSKFVSATISSYDMRSAGTSLFSPNAHWTQDRFACTPYAVALSVGAAFGGGWSGTMLAFTKTRSKPAIETILADASKAEGVVFFQGMMIGSPGAALTTYIYPKIQTRLYEQSPRLDTMRNTSRIT